MKLAVVMPVWVQNAATLHMTYEALGTIRTRHQAAVYLVCTRLHTVTPEALLREAQGCCKAAVRVLHEPGVERSVAGAWNHGWRQGLAWGADFLCILANDVLLEPECLDCLVAYGLRRERADVAIWSGVHAEPHSPALDDEADACDFSCAMLRRGTIDRHGWADENFRPAYFEDNDYAARIVLGGEEQRAISRARFFHRGSMTVKLDAEAAHHVAHWFGSNRDYFLRKWGSLPLNAAPEIRSAYYKHPFNDPAKALSDW